MIKFDLPKNQSSIIKVIGVGGGGSNAVTHMFNQGIKDVDFILCNTDAQAMNVSPVPTKIQLGSKGLGAGSIPSVGRDAAIEKIDDIKNVLEKNTKMLFVTAGMGGGTGTGAAPVIASVSKELDILTVGIVTIPFSFEGRKRRLQAEEGIEELRKHVDTLLVICNDKLRELHGDLKLSEAFHQADNILTTAAKGIAEIVTVTGYINVDFEDVKTVMKNSGKAIMGSANAEGENRSIEAVKAALSSPLLDDNEIAGASDILLYITSGVEEISMDEVTEITDYIQREAGMNAEIIWGNGNDESLGNKIGVTIIATGFNAERKLKSLAEKKTVYDLHDDVRKDEKFESEVVEEKNEKIELIRKKDKEIDTNPLVKEELSEEKQPLIFRVGSASEKTKETKITEPTLIKKDVIEESEVVSSVNKPQSLYIDKEIQEKEINDIEKKSQERIKKLKDLSVKLKSPGGLAELENEPAYLRRNVKLSDTKPSSESEVSRYTLSEDEDSNTEIKSNNSFLHDNVD